MLMIFAAPLQAEIYKWVDAEGNIHYTDAPPSSQQETLEITGSISSYDSPEIVPTDSAENVANKKTKSTADKSGDKSGSNKRVIMYSAAWCGVCKTAKKYFAQNNVRYTEYDIDNNQKAKADFEKMKGRGVPVILVGSRRMNGFSADGFEQLYYGQ